MTMDISKRLENLSEAKRKVLLQKLKAQKGEPKERATIRPADRSNRLLLSFAQKRLWFMDQMRPGQTLYDVPFFLWLSGELDREALARALTRIVQRHEVLRTTFAETDGEPYQIIQPSGECPLPLVDLSGHADPRAAALEWARAEAVVPFDLKTGPLLRVHLVRVETQTHLLSLNMHHIVTDGWSKGLLLRELGLLYNRETGGASNELPGLPIQYADFAHWQNTHLEEKALSAQLDFWRNQLEGMPHVLEWATDKPRPSAQRFASSHRQITLPASLTRGLETFNREQGTTMFMSLLAGFQTLIYRLTGQDDFAIGADIANRNQAEIGDLIGFFVNMLVMRANFSEGPNFRQFLQHLRNTSLDAFANQDLPFERLVEALVPDRDQSRHPIFQVAFVVQNASAETLNLPGLAVDPLVLDRGMSQFDAVLSITETPGRITATMGYATDLFEAETIDHVLNCYVAILENAMAAPDVPLARLPLIDDSAQRRLRRYNLTTAAYPGDRCIHELFADQAGKHGDLPAITFGETRWTYTELDRHANRLANHLRMLGAGHEVPIGLCVQRSAESIAAMLAILRTGGAYVPLDPDSPLDRNTHILEDTGIAILIAESSLEDRLPSFRGQVVWLDEDREAIAQAPETPTNLAVDPDQTAYIVYTSGSTGVPKGIEIPHRGVVRLVKETNFIALGPDHTVAQASTTVFDAATFEIWGALLNGAGIFGIETDDLLSPPRFAEILANHPIDTLFITTALFNQIAHERPDAFANLRHLLFGGEAVDAAMVARVFEHGAPEHFLHVYGPTESTTFATFHRIDPDELGGATLPIGQPIANTSAFVLDPALSRLPEGFLGELFLGGDGLARSYLHQPKLTAATFIPNPFDGYGSRMYRTGDLVRRQPEGPIVFAGRIDHQVKLRGFRIELGEIETRLRAFPEIKEAVVVLHRDDTHGKALAAYFTTTGGLDKERLRASLSGQLPAYMVPTYLIPLDEMPLTLTGKIDRRRLPDPVHAIEETGKKAPRDLRETLLAGIWCDVLGLETIGIHDNFFELGGHSLLATRVVSRIREVFSVDIPLVHVFENPTIEAFAGVLREANASKLPATHGPIEKMPYGDKPPLSFAQERLWILHRMQPENPLYNVPMGVRLHGDLDVAALGKALTRILERHESLRTNFAEADGTPYQIIAPSDKVTIEVEDLSCETNPLELATEKAKAFARLPFNLTDDPLWRVRLFQLAPGDHLFLLVLHHIVTDGWSWGILFRELSHCYRAFTHNETPALKPLPIQYADFARWQRENLAGETLDSLQNYWQNQLAGIPATSTFPSDFPRPAAPSHRGGFRSLHLSNDLAKALTKLGQSENATLFMTLLTAFQILLAKHSGQDDLVIGADIANRNHAEIEDLVGFFINMLVIRQDLSGDPTFLELLAQTRRVALEAYAHQDMPFEKIVEVLEPERIAGRTPLFQIAFVLQNVPTASLELGDLQIEPHFADPETSQFDLVFAVRETSDGIELVVNYSSDLFLPQTVEALLERYRTLLEAILREPANPVSELTLFDREARARLEAWSHGPAIERMGGLYDRIAAHAARNPQAPAILHTNGTTDYGDLVAQVNQLAHYLRSMGIGPEAPVAICLNRTPELAIAILATLAAGGQYVPLDPKLPTERIEFILEDSGALLVLTSEDAADALPSSGVHEIYLDDGASGSFPTEALELTPVSQQAAYTIYTSGSTGTPKGVVVSHGSLLNHSITARDTFGLTATDRTLLFVQPGFDAFGEAFYPSLLAGAGVIMHPNPTEEPAGRLLEFCREREMTFLHLTAPYWHQMVEEVQSRRAELPESLRLVVCGGEQLQPEKANAWQQLSNARLINAYGPTEATITTTFHRLESHAQTVPIGRPIANATVRLLDRHGRLTPVGAVAELCIGGTGLARGYAGRPALTAAAFQPDPYTATPGARLYHSGDLAQFSRTGLLELRGRVDSQIKLHGYRIELGEIENRLRERTDVGDACVQVCLDEANHPRLIAWLTPAPGYRTPDREKRLHTLADGLRIACINSGEAELIHREIFADRCYLQHGITLQPGDCVLDVGANIGLFSMFVHQTVADARVYAFEPIPQVFEALQRNNELYGLDVKAFPLGISDRSGQTSFTYYPQMTAMSGAYADQDADAATVRAFMQHQNGAMADYADAVLQQPMNGETITCRTKTLADVIQAEGLNRIDLLKIDVEKGELAVLNGLSDADWGKIAQIVVEVHDRDGHLQSVQDLLNTHGFQFTLEQDAMFAGTGLYNIYAIHPERAAGREPALAEIEHGHLVFQENPVLDAARIRADLGQILPGYMIPAELVLLEKLPLTANGKIDRKHLPLPGGLTERQRDVKGPSTQVEMMLSRIWAEVLGLEEVGIRDDFFEMGGDSIRSIQVLAKGAEKGLNFAVQDLFQNPTIEALAAFIEEKDPQHFERPASQPFELVAPADRQRLPDSLEDAYPLSRLQEGMLFHSRLHPETPVYRIVEVYHLRVPFDAAALKIILAMLVERHPILRTSFDFTSFSEPLQLVHRDLNIPIEIHDLRTADRAAQDEAMAALLEAQTKGPLNLEHPPLVRIAVHVVDDHKLQLAFCLHHALIDGWSVATLMTELLDGYQTILDGRSPHFEPLNTSFREYVALEKEALDDGNSKTFWLEHLENYTPLVLPKSSQPDSGEVPRWGRRLSAELTENLRRVALAASVPLKSVILAAHIRALALATGHRDLLTGLIGNARPEALDGEKVVGLFLNTLPIRTKLHGGTWIDLARQVFKSEQAMMAHRRYPLAQVQNDLGVEKLVETAFNFVHFHVLESLGDERESSEVLGTSGFDQTHFTLLVNVKLDSDDQRLILGLNGNPASIDQATVERIGHQYLRVLDAMAADPQARYETAPPVEAATLRRLAQLNRTGAPHEAARPIPALFHDLVKRAPEGIALIDGDTQVSAIALKLRASTLAEALRQRGVGPETPVGLHLPRGIDAVTGMLGIMEAGGAYMPLEPKHPAARLHGILEDVRPAVIVSRTDLFEALPEHHADIVCIDQLQTIPQPLDPTPVDLDNRCYIIHTSGSEGRPKGVSGTYRSTLNRFAWEWDRFPFEKGEICCQKTSLGFIDSVWEIFGPLLKGIPLVILDDDTVRDPGVFASQLAHHRITRLLAVPSLLEVLVQSRAPLDGLRQIVASGETLPAGLAERLLEAYPNLRLLNYYGSSEVAGDATFHRVSPGENPIPIGQPLTNTRVYLLDPYLQPSIANTPGAIYLAGHPLARGYANRPALTAQNFLPNPHAEEPGDRMYRTGDLGVLDDLGRILFLGRSDHQLKIRGHRVEPGDIEAALKTHKGIGSAAVIPFVYQGQTYLSAYVTTRGKRPPSRDQLRRFLSEKLPEYMMPAWLTILEALPRTVSGKIDRRALPEPDMGELVTAGSPRTPQEELIAGIWRDQLGLPFIGIHDNFFKLGGHSLSAGRVVNRISRAFGIDFPLRRFFEAATIAETASEVTGLKLAGEALPPIEAADRSQPLPLSFAQQRIWFIEKLRPGSTVFNIPISLIISGPLDVAHFERSLSAIVSRHEGLRTRFPDVDGKARQIVDPPLPVTIPVIDLRGETDPKEAALNLACEAAKQVFDLEKGPLFRPQLIRFADDATLFVNIIHHIVTDGWSMGIFIRELVEGYEANRAERDPALPDLPIQMADYAVWQRHWMDASRRESHLSYWREQVGGAPPLLELPTDHPRPPVQSFNGARRFISIPKDRTDAVLDMARRNDSTLFMVLMAALQVLLSRYSGMEDMVIGADSAGRNRAETEDLIGFFVNMLPIRGDLSGDPSFRELLARTRKVSLDAYDYGDMPFEQLVEELSPERNLSYSPLFQVALVQLNAPIDALAIEGLVLEPKPIDPKTIQYDLVVSISHTPKGLHGAFMYSTDLFEPATIEGMIAYFQTLLDAAVAQPDTRISQLPLVSNPERTQLLNAWNRTATDWPKTQNIPELFADQVRSHESAEALVFGGQRLTYGELERRANQLAHHLQSLGAGPEVGVGVCLDRHADLMVSILAILKAGSYYVPLDPAYPLERLDFMIEDPQLAIILTETRLEEKIPSFWGALVTVDQESFEALPIEAPQVFHDPDQSAYLIYTSGSTGRPKGILIPHRGVVRLVKATNYVDLQPGNVIAQAASISFDAATFEIWGALLNGARLVGVPKSALLSTTALEALIRKEGIDTLFITTALFNELARRAPTCIAALKNVLFGGEAVDPARVRALLAEHAPQRLLHVYGPTEATTYATWHLVEGVPDNAVTIPIGQPIAQTTAYVLDRNDQPVPAGIPGELLIGGEGLARGYAGRPGLTAARFVPNPFGPPGSRRYRTGDRVARNAEGAILFQGRFDHQVKVRGHRIELGEIEAALVRLPDIRDAVSVVHEKEGKVLIAFVIAAEGHEVNEAEIRGALSQHLPDYMVPHFIIPMTVFPMTPGGKVDRTTLAQQAFDHYQPRTHVSPSTPMEKLLAEVWGDVLGVPQVGITDNYFEIGGDSIRSIQVVANLAERGHKLSIEALFRKPTIRDLAEILEPRSDETARHRPEPFELVAPEDRKYLPDGLEDAYPLSRLQLGMMYHSELNPESMVYHDLFSMAVESPFDGEAFGEAFEALISRHPVLRTSFLQDGPEAPLQLVHARVETPLEIEDLRSQDEATQKTRIDALIEAERRRHFDWNQPTLLRIYLHRLSEGNFQFTISLHHAILDGWSLSSLLSELFQHYHHLLGTPNCEVPVAPSATFGEFVALEREALASPESLNFWKSRLEGAGFTRLPRLPNHRSEATGAIRAGHVIDPEIHQGLLSLTKRLGVPLKSALLAAHLLALKFLTGQRDVTTGYITNGRPEGRDGEKVFGLFLNTLPLRVQPGNGTWADWITQVFRAEQDMMPYRRYPLSELQKQLGGQELFETAFNFTHYHVVESRGAFEAMQVKAETAIAETEFTLIAAFDVDPLKGHLLMGLVYRPEALAASQIETFGAIYKNILQHMASRPDESFGQAQLFAGRDAEKLLVDWNHTRRAYDRVTCLHHLFEAQADANPQAPALYFEERVVTYGELNASANQLAHHLRHLGAGPETRIGLCLPRSPEMVIALYGILKAGAAYVPIDPGYPAERRSFMLENAGLPLLITRSHLAEGLNTPDTRHVCIDEHAAHIATMPTTNPETGVGGENTIYLIFTSGSTGRPKCSGVTHRGFANLVHWYLTRFEMDERDRFLLNASLSFDLTQKNLYAPLISGGSLVLQPDDVYDPEAIRKTIHHRQVTVVNCTPSAFYPIVADNQCHETASLRHVFLGGEPISLPRLQPWLESEHTKAVIANTYGPTECTDVTTYFELDTPSRYMTQAMPIGKPIDNATHFVLDDVLQPVPIGVVGELCIGGDGVGTGYVNDPARTAATFVPNPFAKDSDAEVRIYRTGDLVRYLPDGEIDFVGRKDHQVKIRGFRIEMGEIEAQLEQHDQIRQAVVTRYSQDGDERLAAYLVGSGEERVEIGALRTYLKRALPAYMVPSAFIYLDAMPLTPSGKLDRKALPDPGNSATVDKPVYEAPQTETQRQLAAIIARALGIEALGIHDNLFDLGLHSLLMTRIVVQIRNAFGVPVTLHALFDNQTVAQLAGFLDKRSGETAEAQPILRASAGDSAPLSYAQQRLWFVDRMMPGNPVFNIPIVLGLQGELSREALQTAFDTILARHEILRTVIQSKGGEVMQVVRAAFSTPIQTFDLTDLPESERQTTEKSIEDDTLRRPFDLGSAPQFRGTLIKRGGDEHRLIIVFHHILTDTWSLGLFFREFNEIYRATLDHRDPDLPVLPIQYKDFAVMQRTWLSGETGERQMAYWREALKDAPELLDLPLDFSRPAVQTYRADHVRFLVPQPVLEALSQLGQRHGATLYMTLLAAFQTMLYRYSQNSDVCVGSSFANRDRDEVQHLLGFFVNMLVMRARFEDRPSFSALLEQVSATAKAAFAAADVPFERLVDELQPERGMDHSPLFQAVFVLQSAPLERPAPQGLAMVPEPTETGYMPYDLLLSATESEAGLACQWMFASDLFERETALRMSRQFTTLLSEIVHDPSRPVDELPLMEADRLQALIADWHPPVQPSAATLLTAFARQAANQPQEPALEFADETLTYAELDRRTNRMAHYLAALGVGPEVPVGIYLDRSAAAVTAILGVLKAGGTYLPLDLGFPMERIAFMLEDTATQILITEEHLLDELPSFPGHVVTLSGDAEAISAQPESRLAMATVPEQTAYIMYTSGSTGLPKGVKISHGAVVSLIEHIDSIAFAKGRRVAQTANITFDAATFEIWGALLEGGCLVGIEREVLLSPERLAKAIVSRRIDTMFLTTALFHETVRQRPNTFAGLDQLIVGGEAMQASVVERLSPGQAPRVLVNGYGPTENTTFSTTFTVGSTTDSDGPILIGTPLPGRTAFVVDPAMRPLPPGLTGELLLGGSGLASGYHHRPALTASTFIPDAISGQSGARLYRSGDLARRLDDGRLRYAGRRDHQVKLRGFRIELGEIESQLMAHHQVETAAVLLEETHGRHLTAYLRPKTEKTIDTNALRQFLSERLPEYMVPSAFVQIDDMPMTPTGKIDRLALARLEPDQPASDRYVAPQTETETALANILEDVLKVDRVGLHDNFFELGGDSILAIQVLAKAEEAGIPISIQQLFMTPTIDGLVSQTQSAAGKDKPQPFKAQAPFASISEPDLALIPEGVVDAYPVTKLQNGMIYHSELSPETPVYHDVFSYRIRTPFDPAAWLETMTKLCERHPLLRTAFHLMGFSQPLQLVHQSVAPPVIIHDLQHLTGDERQRALVNLLETEKTTPFQWQKPPLLRLHLVPLDSGSFQMILGFHHAILDGWSLARLFSEMFGIYHALLRDEEPALDELPAFGFGDYVALEQQALCSEANQAYWSGRLADHHLPPLPRYSVSKDEVQPAGGVWETDIEGDLYRRLHQFAARAGVPIKSVLLAALLKTQAFACGDDVAVAGLSTNGRLEQRGGDKLLGLFLNMVPVHHRMTRGNWLELAEQVFRTERELLSRRRYPMAEIQRLNDQKPLFHALFNYLNYHVLHDGAAFGGMQIESGESVTETNLPLTFNLEENADAGKIHLSLAYAAGTITRTQAANQGEWFIACLQTMAENPKADCYGFNPMTITQQTALRRFSSPAAKRPRPERNLFDQFHQWVDKTPDAPAIIAADKTLSYAELSGRADRLARRLVAAGLTREAPVAICMGRRPEALVAVLAIVRAGGAYLPLDPAFPGERLAYMMNDAGVRLVITHAKDVSNLPETHAERIEVTAADGANLEAVQLPWVRPDQLAYTLYTSGSTGQPKGVQITQNNVLDLILNTDWTEFNPETRILQLASLGFDASTFEIWGALLTGGACVLLSERVPDVGEIRTRIRENGANTAFITASLFNSIVNEDPQVLKGMRHVLVGGEALSVRHIQRAAESLPEVRFSNGYGPTETTVFACVHAIERERQGDVHTIPIGRSRPNGDVYIVDRHGEPVPIGAGGELLIGGEGLARGYLNNPKLTAEVFVPNPFDNQPGSRLYRSGDQVRWLSDGTIEFIGRIDRQIKLRGFRIELEEISACMGQLPGVADAVAVMTEAQDRQKQIDAYLVAQADTVLDVGRIRSHLAERLPNYMIPSRLMVIDRIPLTANGKLDRKALADTAGQWLQDKPAYAPPRNPTEEAITAIWASVLKLERVGIHDDFMALGGHSLMATLVVSRIRKDFGLEKFPLRLVFENPTAAQLAAVVASQMETNQAASAEVGNLLDFVKGLSDEEAEAYLNSLAEEA